MEIQKLGRMVAVPRKHMCTLACTLCKSKLVAPATELILTRESVLSRCTVCGAPELVLRKVVRDKLDAPGCKEVLVFPEPQVMNRFLKKNKMRWARYHGLRKHHDKRERARLKELVLSFAVHFPSLIINLIVDFDAAEIQALPMYERHKLCAKVRRAVLVRADRCFTESRKERKRAKK